MLFKLSGRLLCYPVCLLCLLKPFISHSADIMTTTPVTLMISQALTQNTGLTTQYLAPPRYGMLRLPNWFSGQQAALLKPATSATVAVTLGAVWPSDPLYLALRQHNIRIIEVDATQALLPDGKGVVFQRIEQGVSPYVWLNSANLLTMTNIVSRDFQRIWPRQAKVIAQNEVQLLKQIQTLRLAQQRYVQQHQLDAVVLLSPELEDLAAGLQLYVLARVYRPALEWTDADKALLQQVLADPSIKVMSTQALSAQHPASEWLTTKQWWQVDAVDRLGRQGINPNQPLARWQFTL